MKKLLFAFFLLFPLNLLASEVVTVSHQTSFANINPEQIVEIGVKLKIQEGWHILGQEVGDIGIPTTIDWQLPHGYEIVDIMWSATKEFSDGEITQYGYEKEAFYWVKIKPSSKPHSSAQFKGDIAWLACFKDECMPGQTSIQWQQPVKEETQNTTDNWQKFNPENKQPSIWHILLFSFLGGIILNFMPCIFPILSLKAISLIQSVQSKKNILAESLLYFAGVVSSFLVMATALIFLRARGQDVGWGFQLQSPVFITLMIIVFCIIFLMLLDIINLKTPFANKIGRISFTRQKLDAFVTGFFAVLIASPCTAPFMGIAIGYTLTQNIYIYYPVFLALAIGYALPFTLIGFFPKALHKMMPRPGKWMEILKKIFAIPIFLTIVWLGWVLFSQLQKPDLEKKVLWQKYDETQISQALEQNRPVFIDFTAKWCITCLANERFALQSTNFRKIVKDKNIALFKADWTNRDATITQALKIYGRNSVPLYVYYKKKGAQAVLLPQLLTVSILEKSL